MKEKLTRTSNCRVNYKVREDSGRERNDREGAEDD